MRAHYGESFVTPKPAAALRFLTTPRRRAGRAPQNARLATLCRAGLTAWSRRFATPIRTMAAQTACGEIGVDSTKTALGCVLSVTGSQAQVRLAVGADDTRATVGKFLGIRAGCALVIGVITKIAVEPGKDDFATGALDMLGEIKDRDSGAAFFQRGVTEYPMI